jgi:hypothetical protein
VHSGTVALYTNSATQAVAALRSESFPTPVTRLQTSISTGGHHHAQRTVFTIACCLEVDTIVALRPKMD